MAISDKHIAILAEDGYQELELHYPRLRLIEAGARVSVLGAGKDEYHSGKGYAVSVDANAADVRAEDFDAVVIPGGMAPDKMRRHEAMVDLVRALHDAGKPVAWICHAGWVPVSADIVRGRRVTSFPSIRDDMVNAGADWVDEEVVVDGNLISSRVPDDLPAFCKAILAALEN
ncbi:MULTISPECIES: type 1 glutamine amidotransferase domain-containing protein [unclassified Wenzhouxiangella]|uniref:type 1 glutamine amidotransferase domain-containing protein n=1 Tax=unclassified Wenzhouxiangella TaxID=2613841 RepID=UPI000E328F87|nr:MULTISPECIES: type 1 glutamine amidotransferase domain-containing protein [unclassified Wenzhouxiangella]RFF26341.1 type 1 glutamine amidotransferase [Wenzhouxiangella sp. 15181]RFP67388.1 type 1 glutamine amidotransferase [Wenzhouxiangella sp. 15190]